MNQSKISVRYAKALYEFATENTILETIVSEVKLLVQSIEDIPEFKSFFLNPIVQPSDKKIFVNALLEKKVSKETIDFLQMLIVNKREIFVLDIFRVFLDMYRKNTGITAVTITSAEELSSTQKNNISNLVEKTYKTKVEILETIDTSILGGFILRIEDLQFDASIQTKLKQVKQELLTKTI